MTIKEAWKDCMGKDADLYTLTDIPAPRSNAKSATECRKICKQNICRCYGVTWGCPPGVGSVSQCAAAVSTFPKCVVISRRYSVSIRDRDSINAAAGEVQNTLRTFNLYLREHGYRTLALADEGCNYCEKCSYPEPCTHPGMRVDSMGGYGIMVVDYLENNGIEVPYEEDAVTIRYLMLFDDTHTH